MTDIDLDELEALAKRATLGEWSLTTDYISTADGEMKVWDRGIDGPNGEPVIEDSNRLSIDDAQYIAKANPSVILQLIEELREAESKLDETHRHYNAQAQERYDEWEKAAAEAQAIFEQEIDELKQENQDLKQEIARHHKDFERWEEMAAKGARQIEENTQLKDRLADCLHSRDAMYDDRRDRVTTLQWEIDRLRGVLEEIAQPLSVYSSMNDYDHLQKVKKIARNTLNPQDDLDAFIEERGPDFAKLLDEKLAQREQDRESDVAQKREHAGTARSEDRALPSDSQPLTEQPCPDCGGKTVIDKGCDGNDPEPCWHPCPTCNGTGRGK